MTDHTSQRKQHLVTISCTSKILAGETLNLEPNMLMLYNSDTYKNYKKASK
jgi:hypothetical protein